MNLIWLNPLWLWLALPLGLLPWLLGRLGFAFNGDCLRSDGLRVRLPSMALQAEQEGAQSDAGKDSAMSWWLKPLLGLSLVLMAIALAEPVEEGELIPSTEQTEPVDAWLMVSTGVSMVLKDYQVEGQAADRMTMAKQVLDRFATEFRGRRLGLVVMGNQPAVWLQPSEDRRLLKHHLDLLETTLGGRNSALGDGLALLAEQAGRQTDEERIVIVFTDAGLELGRHSPREGLSLAREAGLTVYFIVLGQSGDGGNADIGGLLYQSADVAGLEKLLEGGAGRVFHAGSTAIVEEALAWIQKHHQRPVPAVQGLARQTPWYPLPLGLAVLLLISIPLVLRR